ncbi:trimeric LpxA-like protein [Trichoderma sp. SZMC 28014]
MDTIIQPRNTLVHPTSLLDSNCILGHNVQIGPFCHIGSNVTIGDGTELVSNVTILSSTSLGKNCKVYPFAVLGGSPQDKKYSGENTALVIGNKTVIREFVSIHTGTADGGGITRVGNRCYIMTNVHVGHDCQIDDDVVLATGAGLAGHVLLAEVQLFPDKLVFTSFVGLAGWHLSAEEAWSLGMFCPFRPSSETEQ